MKLKTVVIISFAFVGASAFASPVLTPIDPNSFDPQLHRFFGGRFQDFGDPTLVEYFNKPAFNDANEVPASQWGLPWAHLSYDPSTGFLSWQAVTTTENGIDLTNRVRNIAVQGNPLGESVWQVNTDFQTRGSAFIGKPPNIILVWGSSPLSIPDEGSIVLLFSVSICALLGLATFRSDTGVRRRPVR